MTYLGYPGLIIKPAPPPQKVTIKHSRGIRLPPARMVLPVYAFADLKTAEQRFIRLIQSDPGTLCEQLRDGGFGQLEWTSSRANNENWECSSSIDLPAEGAAQTVQSSLFILIKGDGENPRHLLSRQTEYRKHSRHG